MAKKKRRPKSRNAPLLQIGAPKDSVRVLATLERRLEQALTLGRDAPAQEIAREIGRLGGVNGVTLTNSSFHG